MGCVLIFCDGMDWKFTPNKLQVWMDLYTLVTMERLHGLLWFIVDVYGSIPSQVTGVEK